MKKFTILSVIAVLFGCQSGSYFTTESYLLDFRPYAEQGFYMSTTGINQDYIPLGEVVFFCQDGYDANNPPKKDKSDPLYNDPAKENILHCSTDWMLSQLHQEAVNIGGNAIINIRIMKTGTTKTEISGLVVKLN